MRLLPADLTKPGLHLHMYFLCEFGSSTQICWHSLFLNRSQIDGLDGSAMRERVRVRMGCGSDGGVSGGQGLNGVYGRMGCGSDEWC